MKKLILTLICTVLVSSGIEAKRQKIYIPPTSILNEIKTYKEAYTITQNATTIFDLAMSYAYSGQIEKGWNMLKKIPDYDSNYAPKVLKKYSQLINKDPNNWKYHFKIAFGHYFHKDKENAIKSFHDVLNIDPNHIWAMGFIALIEGERNNTDTAIKYCKKALKIEKNATAIHFLLAEGYRRKEDYMSAFKHILIVGKLKTAEKLSPIYDD